MKKQLDLVKILKDCPKGMELDCIMYNNVTLKSVSDDPDNTYPICIEMKCGFIARLTKYGQNACIDDAKCVIFPKGKKTWEGFQRPFIDGDIVINKNNIGTWIGIYHKDDRLNETFSSYCYIRRDGIFCANSDNNHGYYETRLATKEEKEKFFQVVKDHGYKWNPETKTLEKLIVPKFKVGDRIISIENEGRIYTINGVYNSVYGLEELDLGLPIDEQDNWGLVDDKFDIDTLQEFDKVLVQGCNNEIWTAAFFSHCDKEHKHFWNTFVTTSHSSFPRCVPYNNETKHLIGTSQQAPEFYRYWEN